jgi:hypothetical protein
MPCRERRNQLAMPPVTIRPLFGARANSVTARSISPASCALTAVNSTPSDGATELNRHKLGNPVDKEASRRTATVTLSRNYIHRNMARRTRIEYSATHMMSEAQPRLSPTACSLMVNSPWRSNAMGPPPSHSQPATKRMDRSLGQT